MTTATAIYPHQLYADHPGLAPDRPVYLIEDPLLLTEFPIHRAKLMLHRLTMQAYARRLKDRGYDVTTLARTSRMGMVKPVGAPFSAGLEDRERWVLAMQMGRPPKPWAV